METGRTDDDASAGVDLFTRWQAHRAEVTMPVEHVPDPSPPRHARELTEESPVATAPVAGTVEMPVGAPARHRTSAKPPPVGASTDVDFPARVLVRRLVGLLVLAGLVATVYVGYLAYDEQTTLRLGGCGVLAVLTLVLWAIRAGAPVTHLEIRSGRLEVRRGSQRQVVDLTSGYTPVQMVGRPGHSGWKILIARTDQDPVVIDSTMVDPRAFTEALRRYRPELGQ